MRPLVDPGPPLSPAQLTRYSRQLLLPEIGELGQRRLGAARVAVVGAGGLGAPSLTYLAAAGVGHLTVIDQDTVDVTNLQRQVVHRDVDAAEATPKVQSAARAIAALNPDVEVSTRHTELTAASVDELLAGHDLVLDGSDNFTTRYVVADACERLGLPLVWAAVLRFDAQVTTFLPERLAGADAVGLRDLFPAPPAPGEVPSCAEAGVLGALTGQVGSIMAGEAIKLVTGIGQSLAGRVLVLDTLSQRTRELPLRPRDREGRAADEAAARVPEVGSTREVVALPAVSPQQVQAGLDELVLLDVRESGEHAMGTVPGARRVPVGEVLAWEDLDELDAGAQRLVVYCKAGPRAERAARHLVHLGHADVSVMSGGMLAWIADIDPSLPTY